MNSKRTVGTKGWEQRRVFMSTAPTKKDVVFQCGESKTRRREVEAMNEEAWLKSSREMNPRCGCDERGGRIYPCSYHEGASDAWDDAYAAGAADAEQAMLDFMQSRMWDGAVVITKRDYRAKRAAAIRGKE